MKILHMYIYIYIYIYIYKFKVEILIYTVFNNQLTIFIFHPRLIQVNSFNNHVDRLTSRSPELKCVLIKYKVTNVITYNL